jgi:hypothetical protein
MYVIVKQMPEEPHSRARPVARCCLSAQDLALPGGEILLVMSTPAPQIHDYDVEGIRPHKGQAQALGRAHAHADNLVCPAFLCTDMA